MKLTEKTTKRLKSKYGEWVLITGASSGIGKEMAFNFAKAGFKLIITGRRASELKMISTTLFDHYQTETIPISGDLSKKEEVFALLNETKHLEIGIVILNAGFATSGRFLNSSIESELNMLNLNCKAVLIMSRHFAEKMAVQPLKGAIVLLSSIVAFQGVPNAAHYAATKAYIQSFGEGLASELKPIGIDVLVAAPGPVNSGFEERSNMKMGKAMTPKQVSIPIINAVGKRTTLLPGLLTKILVLNLRVVPRWAKVKIMGMVMGGFTKHQV